MKYEDLRFTNKQVRRILAEAAEREARQQRYEEETITYLQLVQSAEEAGINSKYLKTSTNQLVKEIGGLEKVALKNTSKIIGNFFYKIASLYFTLPSATRKYEEDAREFVGWMGTAINPCIMVFEAAWGFKYDSDIGLTVFGTHLAANIASGLYELYRHEKNKLLKEMNGNNKNTP